MKELIYLIDKSQSEQHNGLVIKVQVAEKEGFLLTPSSHQPLITRGLLKQLSSPKETELITFLIEQESAYIKKDTGRAIDQNTPFHTIHIGNRQLEQAFKLFAMTGKLYDDSRALVIDLFGKTEFYYTATSTSGAVKIEGRLKFNTYDIPIHECAFVGKGSPHWFIKGIQLKFISTEVSWQDLKNAFYQRCRPIQELLDEYDDDETNPRVVIDSDAVIPLAEPLPVLILRDRHGAFADLYLDYGDATNLIAFHEPVLSSSKRQRQTEEGWERDLLETDFIKKTIDNSHYYCPLDKVAKSIAFLLDIGWQVRDWRNQRVLNYNKAEIAAHTSANKEIAIRGSVSYGEFEADLSTIAGAFNRRERFVELAPGHVALLPDSWEQQGFDEIFEDGEIVGGEIRLTRNRLASFHSLIEKSPSITLDSEMKTLKEKLGGFQGVTHVAASNRFHGTLRPYQQEGLNWLSFLFEFGLHGILADDMGLGKTVQVLAFLSTLNVDSPTLIVVPTTLVFNWKREIERFLPDSTVIIHHGSKRSTSLPTDLSNKIILTTYTTLRLDLPLFVNTEYACLILDEAQAIKNAQTQTFQAVKQLKGRFRLSITGTPIENHLNELWAHFDFLMPQLLDNEATFNSEVRAGASDGRFFKKIKKKIKPFILRRKKEEVAQDLPEKIEQTVWVEMSDRQREAYDAFLSGMRQGVLKKVHTEGISKHRMEILEAIMRLRQLCCHPLLVNGVEIGESAKLEILLQDLETVVEEKRKVLVYSQFTSMLKLIAKELQQRHWSYVYLDGSTKNREEVVTKFQEDATIPIFLISLKAGGVGLNLTAADDVFLYDPWWNEAAENQAIDRAHRIGRKDTVVAKRYVIAESIEEKILKLKAAKRALATTLLDDDEGESPSSLTVDDLLFLLDS